MRPALRMTDDTLTDFTPTPEVCIIAKRLGFRELDSSLRILLPYSGRLPTSKTDRIEVTDEAGILQEALHEHDAAIR